MTGRLLRLERSRKAFRISAPCLKNIHLLHSETQYDMINKNRQISTVNRKINSMRQCGFPAVLRASPALAGILSVIIIIQAAATGKTEEPGLPPPSSTAKTLEDDL
jgi:hypothetical protein